MTNPIRRLTMSGYLPAESIQVMSLGYINAADPPAGERGGVVRAGRIGGAEGRRGRDPST